MRDTVTQKPNARKRKPDAKYSSRKRRSRYVVAALKACRAICEGRTKQELHPALRLEAAKLTIAIENGVSLPTVNDRLLRKIIAEEIASGEINQTLLRMTGLLDRVERNQRKIAPIVEEANRENAETAPVAKPDVPTEPAVPQSSASDDLKQILQKLKSKGDESKTTFQTPSHQPKESTAVLSAANPMPPTTKLIPQVSLQSHLSEDEIAAVHEFAEFRSSAVELESALSPYLKIEWGGMDRGRITSVSLTGAKIAPEDRVSIGMALVERAKRLAASLSPRDRQLVREWTQVISQAPLFTAETDVLTEVMWLKKQVSL